jgi:putative ABC transport system permease protein
LLEDRIAERYWDTELYSILFLVFAATALLLAALGIYAIVSYSVSRQTREIGLRVAIGAGVRDILVLVFWQETLPIAIGLLIGVAASLGISQILKSMFTQVSVWDPATFAVAAAVLILVALLACWMPAWRAARVDPMMALRAQ